MREQEVARVRNVYGAIRGFGCGCSISFAMLIMGVAIGAVPFVGWVIAVGCVGCGLLAPFVLAWLGYRSQKQ